LHRGLGVNASMRIPVVHGPAHNLAHDLAHARQQAVIVGVAGDPRLAGYQAARARAGLPPAALLDYRELIADPGAAAARMTAPAIVRIESPGRDAKVLAGLLARGIERSARLGLSHWSRDEIERNIGERGRLLPPRQLFFGLDEVLGALGRRAHAEGALRGI